MFCLIWLYFKCRIRCISLAYFAYNIYTIFFKQKYDIFIQKDCYILTSKAQATYQLVHVNIFFIIKYITLIRIRLYTRLILLQLTIIDTTNINTTRVNVISSTCKMYNEDSDCSKYDLQICHTRYVYVLKIEPNNPYKCNHVM